MKKAFTMLELVFVIVVIGILAAVIIPRIESH
ncbi:MAG: type II secretion system protein, partial [Sulfurimonas sp.]